jgi:hypothetical protein
LSPATKHASGDAIAARDFGHTDVWPGGFDYDPASLSLADPVGPWPP